MDVFDSKLHLAFMYSNLIEMWQHCYHSTFINQNIRYARKKTKNKKQSTIYGNIVYICNAAPYNTALSTGNIFFLEIYLKMKKTHSECRNAVCIICLLKVDRLLRLCDLIKLKGRIEGLDTYELNIEEHPNGIA